MLRRFVVLPQWAAEALALWIVHTFAFHLRDITAYVGVESPEKRCGKTTLLTLVSHLVNRPVVASNISPPAFFRVIEELRPTLLIDEADTFLKGNDELRGILNAGNKRDTAYVVRVNYQPNAPAASKQSEGGISLSAYCEADVRRGEGWGEVAPSPQSKFENQNSKIQSPVSLTNSLTHSFTTPNRPSSLSTYSSWCPKLIAAIGHFTDTLADRCIIVRMQRKTSQENCERLRDLDAEPLRRKCARFVADQSAAIASASPTLPAGLNDRAADVWEPLIALADLAGGNWPELARKAAANLSAAAQESNPIASLLADIFLVFIINGQKQLFTKTLVQGLAIRALDRPWAALCKGKEINSYWLGHQLRPYGIKPRNLWIGDQQAKGYAEEDFHDAFRRYVPRTEIDALLAEFTRPKPVAQEPRAGGPVAAAVPEPAPSSSQPSNSLAA